MDDESGNVVSNSPEFDYIVPEDNQSLYVNFVEDGSLHKVVVDAETHLATADDAQNQSVICEAGEAEDGTKLYEVEEGKAFLSGANLGANLMEKSYMVPSEGEYTLIAEAMKGYVFDRWIEVDEAGNELATISWDAEYTFTPNHEMHVRALFTDVNILSIITFNAMGGECETSGSLTWEDGTQITTESVFGEDTTVYAHYVPQADVTFTITTESTDGGSVSPSGKHKVAAGAELSVTAKADKGYRFDGWEIDGLPNIFAEETYTFTYVEQNHTICALFVKDTDPTPTPTETPTPTVTPTTTPAPTVQPTSTPTVKPTIRTTPETNSGSKTDGAKTGDTTNLVIWMLLCVFAAVIFIGISFVYVGKRNKK